MAYDVRFISQADVESLGITMKEVIEHVEAGWKMKGEGKIELPAKIGVHPRPDCYLHAMPCWIGGDVDMAGIKWVAGFPMNIDKNLPYNNGVFILNDIETGVVRAIMDCNWMTTWRTGAAARRERRRRAGAAARVRGELGSVQSVLRQESVGVPRRSRGKASARVPKEQGSGVGRALGPATRTGAVSVCAG